MLILNKFMKLHLIPVLLFVIFSPALNAKNTARLTPLHIEANDKNIDFNSNEVIFSGEVLLYQDNMKINSNLLIITRNPETQQIDFAQSQGNPTTFEDTLADGSHIQGHANLIIYDLKKGIVQMEGDAWLDQSGHIINGEKITYNLQNKSLHATGKDTKRVSTTLNLSTGE